MFFFFSLQPQHSCKTDLFFPPAWGIMSWPFYCFPVKLLLFSIWNYSLPAVSKLSSKKKKINKPSGSKHNTEEGKVVRAHESSNDNGRGKQQPASPLRSPLILHHCGYSPTQSLHFCMFNSLVSPGVPGDTRQQVMQSDLSIWKHPPHESL